MSSLTAASFVAPPERQVMTGDWLGPTTLVVPVDYATYCAASVAREAGLFVVDHRDQFLANREAGLFDGYPDPTAMIGEALDATSGPNRPSGRVVATHLGTGLADVVFGSAILAAAEARGMGHVLRAMTEEAPLPDPARARRRAVAGRARGGRRRDGRVDGARGAARRAERSRCSTRSGLDTRGRHRATRPGSAAAGMGPTRCTRAGPASRSVAGGRSSPRPGRSCSARPARCGSRARIEGSSTPRSRRFEALDIPIEVLSPAEVSGRWPQIATDDITGAVYEPEAGLLMAARGCVAATRRLSELGGSFGIAAVRPGHTDGDRLLDVVDDTGRRFPADAFVFAAGPWLARLFPDVVGGLVSVTKQDVVYLGPAPGDERWTDAAIPCWVDMTHPFYGFPSAEGGGFKVAPDRFGPAWDPTDGERLVDPDAVRVARAYAARRFPDLARQPVIEARVCQYEMTPDSHFLIDRHPAFRNVWLVGGGSGHGYKHGPAIGAHVVGRLDGAPPVPDDRFSLQRPAAGSGTYRIGGDGLVAAWEAAGT